MNELIPGILKRCSQWSRITTVTVTLYFMQGSVIGIYIISLYPCIYFLYQYAITLPSAKMGICVTRGISFIGILRTSSSRKYYVEFEYITCWHLIISKYKSLYILPT